MVYSKHAALALFVLALICSAGAQAETITSLPNTSNIPDSAPRAVLTQGQYVCPTSTTFDLQLSRGSLTDQQAEEIMQNYQFSCSSQLEQLTTFRVYLSYNSLTSLKCLSYILRSMKNLVYLQAYLVSNQISSTGLVDVPNLFQDNPLLQTIELYISYNQISDLYPFKFAFQYVPKLTTLWLDFRNNKIQDVAFASTAFIQLTELVDFYVDLDQNQNIKSLAPLAYAFDRSLELETLRMSFGTAQITSVDFVRTAFQKLVNLKSIFLNFEVNYIEDVSPFETAFDQNDKLAFFILILEYNNITKGIDELINGILVDVGQREAFCPFAFYINSNPLTASQVTSIELMEENLTAIYDKTTCANREFLFYY